MIEISRELVERGGGGTSLADTMKFLLGVQAFSLSLTQLFLTRLSPGGVQIEVLSLLLQQVAGVPRTLSLQGARHLPPACWWAQGQVTKAPAAPGRPRGKMDGLANARASQQGH